MGFQEAPVDRKSRKANCFCRFARLAVCEALFVVTPSGGERISSVSSDRPRSSLRSLHTRSDSQERRLVFFAVQPSRLLLWQARRLHHKVSRREAYTTMAEKGDTLGMTLRERHLPQSCVARHLGKAQKRALPKNLWVNWHVLPGQPLELSRISQHQGHSRCKRRSEFSVLRKDQGSSRGFLRHGSGVQR